MILFIWIMFGTIFMLGIINGITPYFSRRSSQFGVSIPVDYQDDPFIKKQQRFFLSMNVSLSFILGLPILYAMRLDVSEQIAQFISFYLLFALVAFMGIVGLLFLKIRKNIIEFKSTIPKEIVADESHDIVVDTTYRQRRLIVPSYFIIISNLIIILAVVGITLINYEQMPDRIITNWDINMKPSVTVAKSYTSALALPVMQLFMMGTMYVANLSFQKAKQKVDPRNPAVSIEKNRAFRYAWSIYGLVMSILLQLLLGGLQLIMIFDWMNKVNFPLMIIIFVVLIIGGTLILSLKYGQGGERLKLKGSKGDKIETVAGYDDDISWKLGVIYFNSKDPSIWVEKRFGVGNTMNMARWQSWAFLIAILAIPLLIGILFN